MKDLVGDLLGFVGALQFQYDGSEVVIRFHAVETRFIQRLRAYVRVVADQVIEEYRTVIDFDLLNGKIL